MSNPIQTSFIPQQPLLRVEGGPVRHEPLNIPLVVSLLVFFVTILVGAGFYYWKGQVADEILAKKLALQEAEKQFSIDQVRYYERLQVSLDTAKKLVDDHTIFTGVFDLIEARVAKNIGLTALSYDVDKTKGVVVTLGGAAPSYSALYFQIGEWKKTETVTQVKLEDFSLDETSGVVAFSASLALDPASLRSAQVLIERERALQDAAAVAAVSPDLSFGDVNANLSLQ
jgi:hypothetical protein